ncbi:MAG TPA: serine hydrolase [Gemmataceae bacterium]|jgi:CubicO group peptidase (beta-lactamase class C family)|nr:serine hydrolase [Gemmataceae bacterium]
MSRFAATGVLLLAVTLAPGQTPTSELTSADLDNYARKVLADWHAPGVAIAVVKNDKMILARGYGVREIGKPEPVDEHTVFDIASCSKAFTAAALAMLVDQGKLRWNDPVAKHLPGFQLSDPYVTRELTVRDLLCHRSGLGTFAGDLVWYNTTYDRAEVLRRVRFLKPTTSFRSAFGYQNILFLAAGEIVPAAGGTSWDDFMKDRIFTPLGMATAVTRVKDCPANAATPHTVKSEKAIAVPRYNADNIAPAAGVHASVDDLAKWVRLQLGMGEFEGKRIYSSGAARQMWTPQTALPLTSEPSRQSPAHLKAYALGWFVSDYHGHLRIEHDGSIDGMFSKVVLLPELKAGVVALTNSDTPAAELMCVRAVDALLGLPPRDRSGEGLPRQKARDRVVKSLTDRTAAARVKDTKPSLPLGHYSGKYGGDLYGDVSVNEEDGKLVLRFVPAPTFVADLEHWQYDTFRVKWRTLNPYIPDGWATFVLNRGGKPAEMRVDCPNDDFDFTELELKRR